MRRVIKRLFFGTAILFAAFAFLLLGFSFWFPGKWAAAQVSRVASRQTGLRISIESFDPFPLGLFSLKSLSVRTPTDQPLLEVAGISARYRVLPLIYRNISVSECRIYRPRIHVRSNGGVWNYDEVSKLFPPPKKPPPSLFAEIDFDNTPFPELWQKIKKVLILQTESLPEIQLKKLSVSELQIDMDDGKGLRVLSPSMNLELSLELARSHSQAKFSFDIPKGSSFLIQAGEDEISSPVSANIAASWPGNSTVTAQVQGELQQIRVRHGKQSQTYAPLSGSGEFRADFDQGQIQKTFLATFPGWFVFSAQGNAETWGKTKFDLNTKLKFSHTDTSDPLAQLLKKWLEIPKKLLEADLIFNAKGKLLVSTVGEIQKAIRALSSPADVALSASFRASEIPPALVPNGIAIGNLAGDLALTANGKNISGTSNLSAQRVRIPSSLSGDIELPLLSFSHQGDFSVLQLNELKITRATFDISTLGFKGTAVGNLHSKVPFPELQRLLAETKEPVRTLRENITFDLTANANMANSSSPSFLKDLLLQGDLSGRLQARKSGPDQIEIDIQANAKDLSAGIVNGPKIAGLDLAFPIHKTLSLGAKAAQSSPSEGSIWTRSLSQNLRSLSPFANSFHADRIEAAGFTLARVDIDAGYDGTNVVVDRFSADFLGGSLWGKITLLPAGEQLHFDMALEAVDLDANLLIKEAALGDARISADAHTAILFHPDRSLTSEDLVNDLDLQFHLTKIGDQTLDRLIQYLDPKGEDPALVPARGLLQSKTVASALKNPRVSFNVTHGMLDLDIVLPGVKAVDLSIPVRGISVKKLLKLAAIQKSIESLLPLLETARYLQIVGIDDRGEFIFASNGKKG